ncbi:MAG: hypothetical protein ACTSYJ_02040, partial [Candidatus Thorarchaeota archaeon]
YSWSSVYDALCIKENLAVLLQFFLISSYLRFFTDEIQESYQPMHYRMSSSGSGSRKTAKVLS